MGLVEVGEIIGILRRCATRPPAKDKLDDVADKAKDALHHK